MKVQWTDPVDKQTYAIETEGGTTLTSEEAERLGRYHSREFDDRIASKSDDYKFNVTLPAQVAADFGTSLAAAVGSTGRITSTARTGIADSWAYTITKT